MEGLKPYWIRVGEDGLPIATKSDLVRWFVEPTSESFAQFDVANQDNDLLRGLQGYARIPGEWPEPKDGAVWEHLVPFFPQQTICDPGKTEAKPWLYVVGEHEDPWDVAEKFGQSYKAWVQLRQANWDDQTGFARPAADAGLCSFMSWYAGKQIRIPASWPEPAAGSSVWKSIVMPSAGQVGTNRGREQMRTHRIGPADSVIGVAKRYGVSRDELFRANPHLHIRTDRDGFRTFSQSEFRPGKEINIPTPSGSVSGPQETATGAVGGPDEATEPGTLAGCGVYGMDQFGGTVGWRSAQAVQPVRGVANLQAGNRVVQGVRSAGGGGAMTQAWIQPWDAQHPNWNGSQIAYWSQRIERVIAFNSAALPTMAACLRAIQYGQGRDRILAWLRSFGTPDAFKDSALAWGTAMLSSNQLPMMPKVPADLWFADPPNSAYGGNDRMAASFAALMVLEVCRGNSPTGPGATGPHSGDVSGCGGGGCNCGFTPAPNWSQDAPVPNNIGHMHTMMPNWGMQFEAYPDQYVVMQGQIGKAGDPCPMGYAEPAKGVKYIVQKADDAVWKIGNRFGRVGPNFDHPSLRGANSESGTAREHPSGSCNLNLVAGQPINLPLAWFLDDEPLKWKDGANYLRKYNSQSGKWDLPWSGADCPTGYEKDPGTGRCVVSTTPPGPPGPGPGVPTCALNEVYLPVANICVPPGGVVPVNGFCPPGTVMDSTTGMCRIPGGGTPVDVKEDKSEGWPLWLWALLGAGAAGGILLVASATSKKTKKPPIAGRPGGPARTSASHQLTTARTSPRRSRPVEIIDTEGVSVRSSPRGSTARNRRPT